MLLERSRSWDPVSSKILDRPFSLDLSAYSDPLSRQVSFPPLPTAIFVRKNVLPSVLVMTLGSALQSSLQERFGQAGICLQRPSRSRVSSGIEAVS